MCSTHFLSTELSGFADTLAAAPDGTMRHQPESSEPSAKTAHGKNRETSRRSQAGAAGSEPVTGEAWVCLLDQDHQVHRFARINGLGQAS